MELLAEILQIAEASQEQLDSARVEVDRARRALRAVGSPGIAGEGALTQEAAQLQAAAIRELSVGLQAAIAGFSAATAMSSGQLARWTRIQAVATWALVGLTGILAFLTASQVFEWFA